MRLYESMNEYAIPVTHYRCDTCHVFYSICPAPTSDEHWQNCMAPDCESYDPSRDLDDRFGL